MTVEVVSVLCGGPGPQQSWAPDANPLIELDNSFDNRDNKYQPCLAYEDLFRTAVESESEVVIYIHDDVTIHDPLWIDRVTHLFNNPECVCVGLGGAVQLGSDDLYKTRYQLRNLARQGYVSNQTDWQTHGELEKGDRRVAVVDAFFMAVRTDFIRRCGGWPVNRLTHHCLDLWVACESARFGKEVWMSGVSCTHHGGGSSTKPTYRQAKWLQGHTLEKDHQLPHRFLYENYTDVLPIKVNQ